MTHSIYWPGTKVVKSQGNAFTAHARGETEIDWARLPGFAITPTQRKQQVTSKSSGWGNGDMGPLSVKARLANAGRVA